MANAKHVKEGTTTVSARCSIGDGEVTRTYYKIRNEEQYFQSSSVTVFEKNF